MSYSPLPDEAPASVSDAETPLFVVSTGELVDELGRHEVQVFSSGVTVLANVEPTEAYHQMVAEREAERLANRTPSVDEKLELAAAALDSGDLKLAAQILRASKGSDLPMQ